ncbi:head GIN domain-containing protein [Isoptericola sp. b490]|uniref:head GIN domain-containing protein n=1 Tax=Actinotalea lenta TaxID=3064654 RepID=UPI0027126820|nr:head GIN domain-containing protein [Isoptericola sp. b490]MDO8121331.1 head GIN domain-containing protein [Isoptericola sp. b490]
MRGALVAVAAAVTALGLTGCAVVAGPQESEDRAVGDVAAVALATSGDLVVVRGDLPALTVTAARPALERLTSDVAGGRLTLGSTGTFMTGRIGYLLETSHLDRVTVQGSGDVTGSDVTGDVLEVVVQGSGDVSFDRVDARRVTVTVQGSGDVTLGGRSDELVVRVAGSGTVHAFELTVDSADVDIAGSGDVQASPSGTLRARIVGSGDVLYRGDPQVTSQVLGSGDLIRD